MSTANQYLMPRSVPTGVAAFSLDGVICLATAVAIFGYPLVATLPIFFNLETTVATVPFRVFVAACSLTVLTLAGLKQRRMPAPAAFLLLALTVLLVLTLRFIYHTMLLGLAPHPTHNAGEFAVFFYGVTVLPALALCMPMRSRIAAASYRWLLTIGALTVTLTILAVSAFAPEIEVGARAESEGLNAITYASVGATLIMLTWPAGQRTRLATIFWRSGAVALGAIPLVSAASKGPIIALVVAIAAYQIASFGSSRWIKSMALVVALAALAVVGREWAFSTVDGDAPWALALRLSDVGDDTSTLERLSILQSSWDTFATSPLQGGAMVEPVLLAYPHNVLLEALMVGGVFFGIAVTFLLGWTGVRAVTLLKRQPDPFSAFVGMYALFMLSMSMLSGSLYRGPELWVAVALTFAYQRTPRLRNSAATRTRSRL